MRTLVIGDIHGGLKALIQLLKRAKVTQDDKLIFLGDYVDGWSESAQLIAFLINLSKRQECVFIRGNHDSWCELWLDQGKFNPVWEQHGGKETIRSYVKTGFLSENSHKLFFKKLQNYYVDKTNRLFLHAGFSSNNGIGYEQYESTYYFDRSLWDETLNSVNQNKIIPFRTKRYKEIYLGHTPTTNYNTTTPMNAANVWNIDTGAAFKGKLSMLDIDTKRYWQSDPVWKLYPNEKGRN